MKKITILSIIILILINCSSNRKLSTRDFAVNQFSKYDNEYFDWYSYKKVSKNTSLVKEYNTPFKKTKIYLYKLDHIEPISTIIISKNGNNLNVLNKSSLDTIVCQINSILYQENALSVDEFIELVHLIIEIKSPYYKMYKMINSYEDVEGFEKNMPDSIQKQIHELLIDQNNEIFNAKFYLWDKGSAKLYLQTITYKKKKLLLKSVYIGKYGEQHIII